MSNDIRKVFLNLLNIIIGVLMCVGGVLIMINYSASTRFWIALYFLIFGAFIVVLEIAYVPQLSGYILFYYNWFGRGAAYFFIGMVAQGFVPNGVFIALSVFSIVCGLLYIIMHFIHTLPFPYPVIGFDGDSSSSSVTVTTSPPVVRTSTRSRTSVVRIKPSVSVVVTPKSSTGYSQTVTSTRITR